MVSNFKLSYLHYIVDHIYFIISSQIYFMKTKNQTNLIVIENMKDLKKKKKKKKGEKKILSGAVCLPERLIVHIPTT